MNNKNKLKKNISIILISKFDVNIQNSNMFIVI